MSVFPLPDLGEGLVEAELQAWHVSAGDRVDAGQTLATVETDKALVDVASPGAGVIAELCAAPGEHIAVGAPLVIFEGEEAAGSRRDAGTVVGELPRAPRPTRAAPEGSPSRRASPAVRSLARSLDVDLNDVRPSGPGGTMTRADVEAAAAAPPRREDEHGEQLRGVRLAMSRRMATARGSVTPATVVDEVDVEAWSADCDVNARLVRALVAASRSEPSLNAWLSKDGSSRTLHRAVHVALAVQTPEGLFAPVLRNAEALDGRGLRDAIAGLVARTEARRLTPADLSGATLTLSNFGSEGGRFATLVVVPPQVAILGGGRIAPRVVAHRGEPAVRRVLPLSLTFDHRAVTGAEAVRFLSAAVTDLARPE